MVPLSVLVFGTVGIALVAASAAVVNHIADAQIDARMARTHHRPVATGRVTAKQGLAFSAVIGLVGMWVLYDLVNPLTAWLNLASWIGYGIVYTLFLKRATPQNIVIGGLFGAAPPLFGWAAVSNSVEPGALLLVLIIFAWTPPHFWALALDRKEEYRNASIPMLPVTHGEVYTRWHILFYTLILVAISLLPYLIGMSGLIYLASAAALGVGFLYWAVAMLRAKNPRAPIETFRYSILYLMVLFVALLIDHYLPIGVPVRGAFRNQLRSGQRNPRKSRVNSGVRTTVALCLAFVAIVLGVLVYSVSREPLLDEAALREQGTYLLPAPREIAPFSLVDQHGEKFDNASLTGHWSLPVLRFHVVPRRLPGYARRARAGREETRRRRTGAICSTNFGSISFQWIRNETMRRSSKNTSAHFHHASSA